MFLKNVTDFLNLKMTTLLKQQKVLRSLFKDLEESFKSGNDNETAEIWQKIADFPDLTQTQIEILVKLAMIKAIELKSDLWARKGLKMAIEEKIDSKLLQKCEKLALEAFFSAENFEDCQKLLELKQSYDDRDLVLNFAIKLHSNKSDEEIRTFVENALENCENPAKMGKSLINCLKNQNDQSR